MRKWGIIIETENRVKKTERSCEKKENISQPNHLDLKAETKIYAIIDTLVTLDTNIQEYYFLHTFLQVQLANMTTV